MAGLIGHADSARRIMNDDVSDGLLLDVREVNLADLLLDDEDSGLSLALDRLLRGAAENCYNSFGSSL
jgi:hypothetical protein